MCDRITMREWFASELEDYERRYAKFNDERSYQCWQYHLTYLKWFDTDEVRTVYQMKPCPMTGDPVGVIFLHREDAESWFDDMDDDQRQEYTITAVQMTGREAGDLEYWD